MERGKDPQAALFKQVQLADQAEAAHGQLSQVFASFLDTQADEQIMLLFSQLLKEVPVVAELLLRELPKSSPLHHDRAKKLFANAFWKTPLRLAEKAPLAERLSFHQLPKSQMDALPDKHLGADAQRIVRLAKMYLRQTESLQYSARVGVGSMYNAFLKRHFSAGELDGFDLALRCLHGIKKGYTLTAEVLRQPALKRLEKEWELFTADLDAIQKNSVERSFFTGEDLVKEIDGKAYFLFTPTEQLATRVDRRGGDLDAWLGERLSHSDPRFMLALLWLAIYLRKTSETGSSLLDVAISGDFAALDGATLILSPREITRDRILDPTERKKVRSELGAQKSTELLGGDPLSENATEIGRFSESIDGFCPTTYFSKYDPATKKWRVAEPKAGQFSQPTSEGATRGIMASFHADQFADRCALPLPIDATDPKLFSERSGYVEFDEQSGSFVLTKQPGEELLLIELQLSAAEHDAAFPSDYEAWVKQHFTRSSAWLRSLNMSDALEDRQGTMEERFQQVVESLREQGVYDMESAAVRSVWDAVSLKERFDLMQDRAKELLAASPVKDGVTPKLAGICTDFAFLACDLLRKKGIPAGVVTGFNAIDGILYEKDGHAAAFALIPQGEGFGVRLLDATPKVLTEKHAQLKKEHDKNFRNNRSANDSLNNSSFSRVRLEKLAVPLEPANSLRVTEALGQATAYWYRPDVSGSISDAQLREALLSGFSEAMRRVGSRAITETATTTRFSLKLLADKLSKERGISFKEALERIRSILDQAIGDLITHQEKMSLQAAIQTLQTSSPGSG